MLPATDSDFTLASTSLIEDPRNNDDICGLKLSYNYRGTFLTVLISTETPQHFREVSPLGLSDPVIPGLIERFNSACMWTEKDQHLDDVGKRLEALWQETEKLVEAVVLPELTSMIEGGRNKCAANHHLGHGQLSLHDYLFPPTLSLQIVPHRGGSLVVQRPDLPSSLPFMVERRIYRCDDIAAVCPKDVRVLQRFRNHVLKVQVNADIFCCKLNQADAQNSFLREFQTLYRIHNSAVRDSIRVPKLKRIVMVEGGIIGLLTDFVETEYPDMMAVLQCGPDIPRAVRHVWADQIVTTVKLLHGQGLVWGDSKTANVLICKQQNAWLTDFGGGFTRGYIDETLYDSKEGDLQGLEKVLSDIHREV